MIYNESDKNILVLVRSFLPAYEWEVIIEPGKSDPLTIKDDSGEIIALFHGINISVSKDELNSFSNGVVVLRMIPGRILEFETSGGELMIDEKEEGS